MSTKISFMEIRENLVPVIGKPLPGTRLYRKEGPEDHAGAWFEFLDKHFDGLVSPGGAGMFAPVGRAAVHKRLKEGNLTGFAYYITKSRRTFFGKIKEQREKPYMFILVSELKQWAKEIEDQALKLGRISKQELEGDRADVEGDFLDYDSKWARDKQAVPNRRGRG